MSSSVPTSEVLRARIANANGNGNGNGNGSVEAHARAEAPPEHISVIGADILVTGNIEAEVDLHIEGRVQGDVRCATLILGEKSAVVGSVYAQRVRVSGTVEGAIETTDLAIEAGAHVKGDVTYSRLRIANGGIVAGKMTHVPIEGEAGERPSDDADAEDAPDGPSRVHYIE
ncbi:MAG: polymer-forming cytoskeletal protein [Sphingomonas sp.]